MDGRTPISQNLNGTTMSCLNYAKISFMAGAREGQAGRSWGLLSSACSQMAHGASRSIHSAKEEGKVLGIQAAKFSGRAAFTGSGPGQYPSWFETCPRDVVFPVVDTRAITGQRHVPSCSPNMEKMRVTSAIAVVRTWNNAIPSNGYLCDGRKDQVQKVTPASTLALQRMHTPNHEHKWTDTSEKIRKEN